MNPTPITKSHWWQTFVFVLESYLTLTTFILFGLAFGHIDIDGEAAGYMVYSYFLVVTCLFVIGIANIIFGRQRKAGLVALAFAVSAVALFTLLLPILAAAKKH